MIIMANGKPITHRPILLLIWALQGVLALWQYAILSSDAENAVFFGFSSTRLIGLAFLLLWITSNLALVIILWRRPDMQARWLELLSSNPAGDLLLVLSALITFTSLAGLWILRGLSQHGEVYIYTAYADRLAPLLILAALVALEWIAWIAVFHRRYFNKIKPDTRDLFRRTLIVWATLGLLAVFIALTGLGIIPDDSGDWGYPGVPLLEWQILLVCILSGIFLLYESDVELNRSRNFDRLISVAIWLGVVLLWLSQPTIPGFSALAPRAPNHEIYPFADAQVYDEFAQSVLIGNGLKENAIPSRPLYVVFLAFLHLIVGQEYDHIILVQSLILASFPVVLYWIGRDFFGRPVGLSMAVLAALRDLTSNVSAPFTHALSYTKLYLSEIPVAIPMALFIWICYRWACANYPKFPAFLAGGILGIGIMIRTQAVMALPVILITSWLVDRKRSASILLGGSLMLVSITLVIGPWIWRNWKVTGELIFDEPRTQTINLAQRYNNINGVQVDALPGPGESNTDFNRRLFGYFFTAVKTNPGGAFKVFINRFLNNCVGNLLILPLRNDLLDTNELWQPTRPFWEHWYGRPTAGQSEVLAFYILLLGLGLAAAWKRLGLWAFAPLGVNLLYNFWTSVALLSGQRFLLTMDWSIYLYYMIGLFVVVSGFLKLLESAQLRVTRWEQANAVPATASLKYDQPWSAYLISGLFFLLVGASIPLSERIFPKRYPPMDQARIFSQLSSSAAFNNAHLDAACLQDVIDQNHLTGYTGRALSPRFYDTGEGENTAKQGYAPSDQSRLVFQGSGNRYGVVILNLPEAPDFFPHAADVLFYLEPVQPNNAWVILVTAEDRQELYLSKDVSSKSLCLEEN